MTGVVLVVADEELPVACYSSSWHPAGAIPEVIVMALSTAGVVVMEAAKAPAVLLLVAVLVCVAETPAGATAEASETAPIITANGVGGRDGGGESAGR